MFANTNDYRIGQFTHSFVCSQRLLTWSTEHMCTHPAILSVLRCFCDLSFLSNAQNSILSKNSLAIVQGEVYSPPCPCMRPSANVFTASWLKMASPAGIGLRAQNSILSKNSLAIVQGEVYTPPCPCMRQSANAFTASWPKMASLAGIGIGCWKSG